MALMASPIGDGGTAVAKETERVRQTVQRWRGDSKRLGLV